MGVPTGDTEKGKKVKMKNMFYLLYLTLILFENFII